MKKRVIELNVNSDKHELLISPNRTLLEENPTPTKEEVLRAISGNLCRCTGYFKITKAIMKMAGETRP